MEVLSDQLSRKKGFSQPWEPLLVALANEQSLGSWMRREPFYLLSFFCAHIWERVGESGGLSKVLLLFLRKKSKGINFERCDGGFLLISE